MPHFTADISFVVIVNFILNFWFLLNRFRPSGDETDVSERKEKE